MCSLSVRALVLSEEKSATKGSTTKFHHSLSIYHDNEYTPLLANVCSGFCHYGFVVILIFTVCSCFLEMVVNNARLHEDVGGAQAPRSVRAI